MALHPHRQGLQPPQYKEGVEGTGHRAGGVLKEAEPLVQLGVAGDQASPDHVAVAPQVLGGGVQHHIGAEVEGALQVRGGKGVVHHEPRPGIVGDGSDRLHVGDPQQRVTRRLQPHQLGLRPDRRRHRGKIGRLGDAPREPLLAEHPGEEAKGAAVGVVGQQDMVAQFQGVPQQSRRSHPRCGGGAAAAAALIDPLEGGEGGLQRRAGRVVGAGVVVPGVLAGSVLGVGAGGVDRDHDGARGGFGVLAGMDRLGLELHSPSSNP